MTDKNEAITYPHRLCPIDHQQYCSTSVKDQNTDFFPESLVTRHTAVCVLVPVVSQLIFVDLDIRLPSKGNLVHLCMVHHKDFHMSVTGVTAHCIPMYSRGGFSKSKPK